MALSLMDHLNNAPDDIYRHIIEFVGVDIPKTIKTSIDWCNLCGEDNNHHICEKSTEFGFCYWCQLTFRLDETNIDTCCSKCYETNHFYYYPSIEDFVETEELINFYNNHFYEVEDDYEQIEENIQLYNDMNEQDFDVEHDIIDF